MPTVFDLVKAAGAIPLDELTVLSPQSPEAVKSAVDDLERAGLVEIKESAAPESRLISLTNEGYRRALK